MMGNKSEVKIENVEHSEINVKVTQILSKSLEYNELLDQLNTQQKLFDRTPEDEQKERLEISAKINELTNRITQFKEDVLRLAEQFQRIEINTDRLRRAKEFFDKGEFGEARAVLECELEQMQDEQRALLIKREEYEQNTLPKLQANAEEFLILALSTQTHYDNLNWFNDTCRYFEDSIKSYASKDNIFYYAYFLNDHNQLTQAEIYYQRYLNDFVGDISIDERATTLNNLAILHKYQNNYNEALREFEESLQIYRQLAEVDPQTSLPAVAMTLNNLAVLHRNQNNYDEALEEYEEALQIYRQLAEVNPQTSLPDVAMTLNNLAILHQVQNNYDEALGEYEEALQIRRQLAEVNPQTSLPNVATTLNNLAVLHSDQNNYDEALGEYEEALQIYRQLAEVNPQTSLPNVAMTLNNLANLHQVQNNSDEALKEYEEALQIYRQLAEVNPQTYLPDLAMAAINFSIFNRVAVPNREKSISYAVEAIKNSFPYIEKVPITKAYFDSAMTVLRNWDLNDEEIEQLIAEKMDENGEN